MVKIYGASQSKLLIVFPADGAAKDEFHNGVTPTSVFRSNLIFCLLVARTLVRHLFETNIL